MAKQIKGAEEKRVLKYPSDYGSHASMSVEHANELVPDHLIVLKDNRGLYITERSKLDTGLADPNRHSGDEFRSKKLAEF